MNRIRMASFATCLALLAFCDWGIGSVPAGNAEGLSRSLAVGPVTVTASAHDLAQQGVIDRHLALHFAGSGTGGVKVRLTRLEMPFASRMLPSPQTVWEREVTFDTGACRSLDLGPVVLSAHRSAGAQALSSPPGDPAQSPRRTVLHELLASGDGQTWVQLLSSAEIASEMATHVAPPVQ